MSRGENDDARSKAKGQLPIGTGLRAYCISFGSALLISAVTAVFLSVSTGPTVALLAAGTILLVIGIIGRIPTTVGIAGGNLSYDQRLREQIESALSRTDQPIESRRELSEPILAATAQLRDAGQPVIDADSVLASLAYSTQIEAALKRRYPATEIQHCSGLGMIDFRMVINDTELYVETGFSVTGRPMPEYVLREIIKDATAVTNLLVVTNEPPAEPPYKVYSQVGSHAFFDQERLPANMRMVIWKDESNDKELHGAIDSVIAGPQPPSSAVGAE